ncbi:MAG: DUF4147 domain-containing protein [Gammaproteobacteria bacterium]|nr:DUF4147 domain-containing protein [Gammaproteobacteria bacterium]MDH5650795.1 DUF4147 domain-containing protein [Gammaproteobacteria bacterium]
MKLQSTDNTHGQILFELLQAGLAAVDGRRCVQDYFARHPLPTPQAALIAVGKAASDMAMGCLDYLGEGCHSGLVITKTGYLTPQLRTVEKLQCIESAHPVPDASSLYAGQVLLDFLDKLPEAVPLVMMISGGTSALVEVLPEGLNITDLQRVNQWLLASGLPIDQMNLIRQSVSLIKGGRLIAHLRQRPVCQLLLSDVPGDEPATIGSGLLVVTANNKIVSATIPDWLQAMQAQAAAVGEADVQGSNIETALVGTNRRACEAIQTRAIALGLNPVIQPESLHGEAVKMAEKIVATLEQAPPGVHIWGGETTVVLPDNPGRGGRNQQLALALALLIRDRPEYRILVAATDGSDGPTEDAGALVDGGSIARGEAEGLSAGECLAQADAGRFLAAAGDLVSTGPTGTNVMDLVIVIKL